MSIEVESMRRSFEKISANIKLIFLCLDKRTLAKFYSVVDKNSKIVFFINNRCR